MNKADSILKRIENILWSIEVKGDLLKAREKYMEVLGEIKELPESEEKFKLMSFCMMRIANVENALGNIEDAEEFAREALKYATKSGEKVSQGRVLLVLSSILNTKQKFEEALTYVQKAKLLFKESYKEVPEFDAIQGYGWALLLEGSILLNMGKIQKAEGAAKEALKVLEGINNIPGIINAYEVLARVYDKVGKLEEKRRTEEEIKRLKENLDGG